MRRAVSWVAFLAAVAMVSETALADSLGSAVGGTAAAQSSMAGGLYQTSPSSLTNGQQAGLRLQSDGSLSITCITGCSGGSGGGGTSSNFGAAFPAAGTAAGVTDGTNMRPITGINYTGTSYAAAVDLVTALPAGSNVIGHVITDTGSTTAVTGNVTAVQGTASNLHALVTTNADGSASGGTAASVSLLTGGIYNSSPITLTNGQQAATQLDTNGYLNVHVQAGGGSGGTSSSFGSAFPSTGTAVGVTDGTNMRAITGINYTGSSYAAATSIVQALPAGANVIGHVITDTGSTTAVTGTVTVTATNLSTNLAQVNGATTATAASGVLKVGIVGSGNTTLDGTVGAGTSPSNGLLTLGQYASTPPTPSNGQTLGIQIDSHGYSRGVLMDAAGNNRAANVDANSGLLVAGEGTAGSALGGVLTVQGSASGTPIPVSATNLSSNVAQFGGSNVVTGTGAGGSGIPRVTVSSDSTVGLVAGSALVGKVGIDQTTVGTTNGVTQVPATSGGLSIARIIVAANTTSVAVKSSAGQVYHIDATNNSTTVNGYLKLYNIAQGSNTCGSNTPIMTFMVPFGGGLVIDDVNGFPFATAISACYTTGLADADTGAPVVTSATWNIGYK